MNNICTSIEQSKKLIELGIDINTADMYWFNRHIDMTQTKYELFVVDKSDKYIDFFNSYAVAVEKGEIIPAWSISALLSLIKPVNGNTYTIRGTLDGGAAISFDEVTNVMYQENEIIDAVYNMILWLHKKK